MSPGMRGNCVSSIRIPTVKPKMFCPPLTLIALVQLGQFLTSPAQMTLHGLVVFGVRELRQVALPVPEAATHLAEIAPGDTAVAPLAGRFRVQHEQSVDGAHHPVPLLPSPVGALEIGEHASDDLAPRDGRIVLGLERYLAAQ